MNQILWQEFYSLLYYNSYMMQPILPNSFEILCKKWAHIINGKECGITIWPPISGAHMRIKQFLGDKDLQKKLLRNPGQKLLFINAEESSTYNISDFTSSLGNCEGPIAVFLTGLDSAFRSNRLDLLSSLNTLITDNPNLSVILFTEINIDDPQYKALFPKSIVYQNVFYQPLYSVEDSVQFFHYLTDKWSFQMTEGMISELVNNLGGHFLLLKEAARIVRDNPDIDLKNILAKTSLIQKAIAIFQALDNLDKKIIISVLQGQPASYSDYLTETHLLAKTVFGIPYWQHLRENLMSSYQYEEKLSYNFEYDLTPSQRDIYELLSDTKSIVTREQIAKKLWQENHEEKYSDWAIDQLMHKLREKIKQAQLPFEIITKKGEGFILNNTKG